jgi:hypothetical protein
MALSSTPLPSTCRTSTKTDQPRCEWGGGAIFDRGGQLKVIDARFTGNRCDSTGPDLGGAAIRALSQYQNRPIRSLKGEIRALTPGHRSRTWFR